MSENMVGGMTQLQLNIGVCQKVKFGVNKSRDDNGRTTEEFIVFGFVRNIAYIR